MPRIETSRANAGSFPERASEAAASSLPSIFAHRTAAAGGLRRPRTLQEEKDGRADKLTFPRFATRSSGGCGGSSSSSVKLRDGRQAEERVGAAAAATAAAVAPEEAPPQAQTARALCLRSFVLGRRDCGPKITDDVGKNVKLDSAISGEDDDDDDDDEEGGNIQGR